MSSPQTVCMTFRKVFGNTKTERHRIGFCCRYLDITLLQSPWSLKKFISVIMRKNWGNLYCYVSLCSNFPFPSFPLPPTHAWLRFILILLYDKFLKRLEAVGRERCNKNNRGERALVLIITLTPNDFHQSCKHVPKEGFTRLLPCAHGLAPQRDTEWEQMGGNKHIPGKQTHF